MFPIPPDWPRANPDLHITASFKQSPEDFIVEEVLGFEPSGEGEHIYLQVRKTNTNTQWLAKLFARYCGIKQMDVGYAGLKDRNAVTTQWFSLYMGNKADPDWSEFSEEGVEILRCMRHNKKLRRGVHQGNKFIITLRDVAGAVQALDTRLHSIAENGVPNYFGSQRFGHDFENLRKAEQFINKEIRIKNQQDRGFMISVIRSFIFNEVLAERIRQANWQTAIEGDVLIDDAITGPLWGRGRLSSQAQAQDLENALATSYPQICDMLEHVGLKQERRKLTMKIYDLNWILLEDQNILRLEFMLEPGTYATSLLSELVRLG